MVMIIMVTIQIMIHTIRIRKIIGREVEEEEEEEEKEAEPEEEEEEEG